MDAKIYVPIIVAAVLVVAFIVLGFYLKKHPNSISVRFISRVAIFTAMATILYVVPIFQFKLPFFPAFLEIHLDEIPSMIAGFAFGPWVGIATVFLTSLIKLPFSSTMYVGELSDFLLRTVVQVLLAMVLNVYVLIPFYINLMGFTEEALLGMMQAAVPSISNVGWSYAFFAVLPFNLLKDAIVIAVTLVCYKLLARFLERFHQEAKREKGE